MRRWCRLLRTPAILLLIVGAALLVAADIAAAAAFENGPTKSELSAGVSRYPASSASSEAALRSQQTALIGGAAGSREQLTTDVGGERKGTTFAASVVLERRRSQARDHLVGAHTAQVGSSACCCLMGPRFTLRFHACAAAACAVFCLLPPHHRLPATVPHPASPLRPGFTTGGVYHAPGWRTIRSRSENARPVAQVDRYAKVCFVATACGPAEARQLLLRRCLLLLSQRGQPDFFPLPIYPLCAESSSALWQGQYLPSRSRWSKATDGRCAASSGRGLASSSAPPLLRLAGCETPALFLRSFARCTGFLRCPIQTKIILRSSGAMITLRQQSDAPAWPATAAAPAARPALRRSIFCLPSFQRAAAPARNKQNSSTTAWLFCSGILLCCA